MTEAQWLTCTDPNALVAFVDGRMSDRKARLLACALGRRLWPYLGDDRSRRLVEVAERFADEMADSGELAEARQAAYEAVRGGASRLAVWAGDPGAWQAARVMAREALSAGWETGARNIAARLTNKTRSLVRCIFGNPFRPVAADPAWLTSTAVGLASAIYAERAFDRLPILADALEDAGCDHPDVLAHCRTHPEHARGCWVVDLILGKS
jgi:hypothetical protein